MKKLFVPVFLVCFLAIVSCTHSDDKTQDDHQQKEGSNLSELSTDSTTLTVPYEITTADVDMDFDGENEKVRIMLIDGEKIEGNLYKGQFAIQLYDSNNELLNESVLNENISYLFPQNFNIIFKDYNNDGNIDFNIGNPSPNDDNEYIYKFYTLSHEGLIKELEIKSYDMRLNSCQKAYSFDFVSSSPNSFTTYDFNGEEYEYKVYRWQDDSFIVANHIYSPLDYNAIKIDEVIEKIDTILSKVDVMDEKSILEKCEEEYLWLLSNNEATRLYYFMTETDYNHNKRYDLEWYLISRIHELEQINSQFAMFGIEDIRNYNLAEIMHFESPYAENDYQYEKSNWKVEDENYQLLVGGFHLDNFILLFDEEGQYLDGRVWTDKARNKLRSTFREKQNYVSISPIIMGYGTGIYVVGGEWFEAYKGKLISQLAYLIEGYESPPFTIGYIQEYELYGDQYDLNTGDYKLSYRLGTGVYGTHELLGIKKSTTFQWDDAKKTFEPDGHDLFEHVVNELFTEGIEDEILDQNYERIQEIIRDDKLEYKEENMENMAVFLAQCSPSDRRDDLINELIVWYEAHSDVWNSEELIKMFQ